MMKKTLLKIIPVLLIGLALFSAPVYRAESAPDPNARCTLRIGAGSAFILYPVAEWVQTGADWSWRVLPAFENCGIPEPALSLAENAAFLADYARNRRIEGATAEPDAEGVLLFEDLDPGLYLAVQKEPAAQPLLPFPVILPYYSEEEGRYSYNLYAEPKAEPPALTQLQDPPGKEDLLPDTGQHRLPVLLLLAGGLCCWFLAWRIWRLFWQAPPGIWRRTFPKI